jgi:transketolase
LDEEAIIKAAEETGAIVTAENGTIIGGLGEGVAAVLAENMPVSLVRVGVEDEFSQSARLSAEKDELKDFFGLSAEDIAVSVKECMNKRDRLQRKKRNRT